VIFYLYLAALARAGLDFKTAKRVLAWSEDER